MLRRSHRAGNFLPWLSTCTSIPRIGNVVGGSLLHTPCCWGRIVLTFVSSSPHRNPVLQRISMEKRLAVAPSHGLYNEYGVDDQVFYPAHPSKHPFPASRIHLSDPWSIMYWTMAPRVTSGYAW